MSHFHLKGTAGSVINHSYPFEDSLLLGAAPVCDVQIDEAGVAEKQAEIRRLDGRDLLLSNLDSRFETLINGVPVQQQRLNSGDEIRIGSCRWMLQAPGLRPARVLTADVVNPAQPAWPRVLVWTLVAVAAAAVAILKYAG